MWLISLHQSLIKSETKWASMSCVIRICLHLEHDLESHLEYETHIITYIVVVCMQSYFLLPWTCMSIDFSLNILCFYVCTCICVRVRVCTCVLWQPLLPPPPPPQLSLSNSPFSHCGNTVAHRWLSPSLWWVGRVGGRVEELLQMAQRASPIKLHTPIKTSTWRNKG